MQITFLIDYDFIAIHGFSSTGLPILEGFLHLPGGWGERGLFLTICLEITA